MKIIKQIIKKLIVSLTYALSKTRVGILIGLTLFEEVEERVIKKYLMNNVKSINYNGIKMQFSVPNQLNRFRIDTFSNKEPETLDWIDSFAEDSILWDIGANIGLYSIYAAKTRNCRVYAFEPSVFNLELLARNCFLNQVQQQVAIMPVALSDKMGFDQMHMTTTEWGGALSTFGKDFGWDGQNINSEFEFQTFGLSMDQALDVLQVSKPDYIKMDVDGLEHIILKGGSEALLQVQEILIEVNDDFAQQAVYCQQLLTNAGLILKEKCHADMFDGTIFSSVYNQIWIRKQNVK